MDLLLDTNIIIIYGRDNNISNAIEQQYQIFSGNHRLFISTVTLGEINAFVKKANLGETRKQKLLRIIDGINKISIDYKEIIEKYGDIDAFSQGKMNTGSPKFSAKNMGKNDVWIAATASVFNLKVVTTDKDFDHLQGVYLDLAYIALPTAT